MKTPRALEVAVLLATHNGSQFVESQIRSLMNNDAPFRLHWLDDISTDNTREIVRAAALSTGIDLRELHQPQYEGIPGAFFCLLECVEADIYLFCDQDDIWQPGKIDAAVADLLPDIESPVLCFSDPLMFRNSAPDCRYRLSHVLGAEISDSMHESRLFMPATALGNTQAFTRPLRDIFLAHKHIARTYAAVHDMWIFFIAIASGTVRALSNVPTTLYRRHGNTWCGTFSNWKGNGIGRYVVTWKQHQSSRVIIARHAQGFMLLSPTLPPGPKLDRILEVSKLVSKIDRRQSLIDIVRLARRGAMWPSKRLAGELAAVCLCSDAAP